METIIEKKIEKTRNKIILFVELALVFLMAILFFGSKIPIIFSFGFFVVFFFFLIFEEKISYSRCLAHLVIICIAMYLIHPNVIFIILSMLPLFCLISFLCFLNKMKK